MNVFEACMTGNLEWLKQQTVTGQLPDLMQPDEVGRYPHEYAALNGHLDVLKWLVEESGQPVDITAADNVALRAAAFGGHLDVIKWLVLESGQSVDVTADDNSAVRLAASNGHLDIIKWLVNLSTEAHGQESGQPVDATAGDNEAVCSAACYGHLDVVKWLVEESGQPVDVTAQDSDALRLAAENGRITVVNYLNVVTPLIQAVGLDVCRSVGFEAVSELLTVQAAAKPTARRL